MMTRSLLAALLTLAAAPNLAMADPRIREVPYDPHAVTTLHGCFGYQSTVVFGPGERIQNVALGDAQLWQATPNKGADLLFLKPSAHNVRTNMMVVTDRHRYAFDLTAREDAACRPDRVVYELQFSYPSEPAPPAPAPADTPPVIVLPAATADADLPQPAARNTAYTFTGAKDNVPERVFDDGGSTYLRWPQGVAAPAIYALGPGKAETLVNYIVKGDYTVIDGVGPAFVLRRGSAVAVLYNDAYQQPKLDADAPRPRAEAAPKSAKPSMFARLFAPAAPAQETGQ